MKCTWGSLTVRIMRPSIRRHDDFLYREKWIKESSLSAVGQMVCGGVASFCTYAKAGAVRGMPQQRFRACAPEVGT